MTKVDIEFDKSNKTVENTPSNNSNHQNSERSEYLELLQRTKAEFDNFKKRTEKEKLELSEFVEGNLISKILPVLDDFERMLQSEIQDMPQLEGCRLIYKNLNSIFTALGLNEFGKIGDSFDPNMHEAIAVKKGEDEFDNKIMSIIEKGYIFKNRILRYAKVEVGAAQ